MSEHVTVILGAGASHDVLPVGGVVKDERWRPPLTERLFSFDHHEVFHQVVLGHPLAERLTHRLAAEASQGTLNLEDRLRESNSLAVEMGYGSRRSRLQRGDTTMARGLEGPGEAADAAI